MRCHLVVRTSISSVFSVTFMKLYLYFCCMSFWVRAQCEVFGERLYGRAHVPCTNVVSTSILGPKSARGLLF